MEKKEKKPKKEKKVVVPFDQIDIKTATEDEIIKSGIRHNVKEDFICYGVMFLIVVLILLPPLLRAFNPKPITEIEKDITYVTLTCSHSTSIDDYAFYTNLENNYRDGALQKLELKYSYKSLSELGKKDDENEGEGKEETPEPSGNEEEPTFAPIEKAKQIDAAGITKKKVDKGYVVTADFENHDLYDVEQLKEYAYVAGAESEYLTSIGFYCSTESKIVKEIVYVDTNKKVE